MKVWLIIRHDYDDFEVIGIATNRKIAKEIRDVDKMKHPHIEDTTTYASEPSYIWEIKKYKVRTRLRG